MKRMFILLVLSFAAMLVAETITLTPVDKRFVSKNLSTGVLSGPTTGTLRVGITQESSVYYAKRSAATYNPSSVADYVFVSDEYIVCSHTASPNEVFLFWTTQSSDPRYLSKENLYSAIANQSNIFYQETVESAESRAVFVGFSWNFGFQFHDYLKPKIADNSSWLGLGLWHWGDESSPQVRYVDYSTFNIRFEAETRPMSASGELTQDENWHDSHSLSGNVTVPSGKNLKLFSSLSLTLNGYNVISTGGSITGTWSSISPSNHFVIKSGSAITMITQSISTALANATSGQTIEMYGSLILNSDDVIVPSGVTFSLKSGSSITLNNNKKVDATNGTITIASGVTLSPSIQRKNSSGTIKGLYPTIANAITAASSGDDIQIGSGSYTENVSIAAGVDLLGAGAGSTTITGNVTFSYISSAILRYVNVRGNIVINGGTGNWVRDVYFRDILDINYGSGHNVYNCRAYQPSSSGRLDVYQTNPSVQYYYSTESGPTYGVYCGDTYSDMSYSEIRNKSTGFKAAIGVSGYVYNVTFCNGEPNWDFDIASGSSIYINGNFATCPPRNNGAGDVDEGYCYLCSTSKAAFPATAKVTASFDQIFFEDIQTKYREVREQSIEAFDAGQDVKTLFDAEYQEIIEKLKTLVSDFPESPYAGHAARLLSFIYEERGTPGLFIEYADAELKKAEYSDLEVGLRSGLVHAYVGTGEFEKAVEASDAITNMDVSKEQKESALYGKGVIYQYFLGDKEKATEAYKDALSANPQSQYAENIAIDLAREGRKVEEKPIEEVTESEGFSLENYPNPANPTTTIVYTLSEASDVLVQVFDVRGRLVQTLVSGAQETGKHTIVWNGADEKGIAASSGMYFCRLQAGEKTLTRKMLLVR